MLKQLISLTRHTTTLLIRLLVKGFAGAHTSYLFFIAGFPTQRWLHSKFSDKQDRLYISNEYFDLNLIFTDIDIHKSSGIIAVLDKESGHLVPHYITEPGNIRLIWRTVVRIKDSRDPRAVGFRLLTYTDGRLKYWRGRNPEKKLHSWFQTMFDTNRTV